jgi:nitroreductase
MTSIAQADIAEISEPEVRDSHPDVLDVLLSRQSFGVLRDPAPSEEDLARILDVGLRAPDHGRLRPWRFVLIRGAARTAYADLLVEALKRREGTPAEAAVQKLRERILGVPLIIAVGAKIKTDGPIPEIEQLLSTGAAAMNMLNATHALGYGAKWVTGANAYDRSVNEALGFTWPDRLVGPLFVGTKPKNLGVAVTRPVRADHVREWSGVGR